MLVPKGRADRSMAGAGIILNVVAFGFYEMPGAAYVVSNSTFVPPWSRSRLVMVSLRVGQRKPPPSWPAHKPGELADDRPGSR